MASRTARSMPSWPLLVAVFLALLALLGLLFLGPPEVARPLTCPPEGLGNVVRLPPLPRAADGVRPELIATGNNLASRGRLDAAERLYDRALALDPPDSRAGRGLAYVQARRGLAVDRAEAGSSTLAAGNTSEARHCFTLALGLDRANQTARDGLTGLTVPDTRSLPEQLADGWDATYQRWLVPAGRAALGCLGALAILLVLARLLTPIAVPGDAPAWDDRVRSVAWWTGLALLVVAALRSTAFSGRGPSKFEGWFPAESRLVVVTGLIAVAAGVLHRSRGGAFLSDRWTPLLLLVGGVAAVLVADAATPGIFDDVWPWILSAGLALVGSVLIAAGRGHALRLQVRVRRGADEDPTGTAYVLARLEDLGSAPPRGLKAPQQVDVQDLPSSALSSLPAGKVAAAVSSVLGLVTPSVPWRATVAGCGEADEVVVTVTRNGSVAGTAIINGARFRPKILDSVEDGDVEVDPSDLLTAAAAMILTELAARHPSLQVGLCGARRWESVSAYVVATKPPETRGGRELRKELLAAAVGVDPGNALARLAYVRLLAEESRAALQFRRDAARLHQLMTCIPAERTTPRRFGRSRPVLDDGWMAFRLRTWHALTATWLNACADSRPLPAATRDRFKQRAAAALSQLHRLSYRDYEEPKVNDFALQFRPVVRQLGAALAALPGSAVAIPLLDGEARATEPPGVFALYDRACVRAYRGLAMPALEDLRLVAGMSELRMMARSDPWFERLRELNGGGRFWDIVGPPEPEFTALPPFGDQGAKLRALGVRTAADLLAVTSCDDGVGLARSLRIPLCVVERWVRLAELGAAQSPGDVAIDTQNLRLLLAQGVASAQSLLDLAGPVVSPSSAGTTLSHQALLEGLRVTALQQRVRPPGLDEVAQWVTKARSVADASQRPA